jgi:dTMP kinase
MNRGLFITFEGIDGAGKSSHIAHVADWFRSRGRAVVLTREPGGTPVGERLREMLLSTPMDVETETLLMFAARQEHVKAVIAPALARCDVVLCDRFTDATRAYQGGGRGVSMAKISALASWVHADCNPDLTLLFDVPPETAQDRMAASRANLDRFEQEKVDFHTRVRQTYLALAQAEPGRFRVLDSRKSITAIQDELNRLLEIIDIKLAS